MGAKMQHKAGPELERLADIMARLRAEGGCPWDREQDLRSLRRYLLEEAFEVLDEMDRVCYGGPWRALCEELGDLLFQVVFHAQLATELGEFNIADVCRAISDKIVSRHPHVFADTNVAGAEQVLSNWAKLKAEERRRKTGRQGSVLDGVPSAAPALLRAERLTEKASRIGFDWPDLRGVRSKLDEELAELDEAIASGDRDALEHELGDVLFSLANLARFIRTPAEDALRQANRRFTARFHQIEEGLEARGVPFGEATLELMEELWQAAKAKERQLPPPIRLPQPAIAALRLPLRDAVAMKTFYLAVAQALGWSVFTGAGELLRVGAGPLEVQFVPGQPGGPVHLVAAAPSARAVSRLRARLRAIGVEPTPDQEDALNVQFNDPDGNSWTFAFGA
jgi:nucleoside triphosphate diphosphatase